MAEGSVSRFMVWWPLAAAIFAFVTYGAHADTTLAAHETRLMKVEAMSAEVAQRLARVEQMAADTQATAHRIERQLDGLRAR